MVVLPRAEASGTRRDAIKKLKTLYVQLKLVKASHVTVSTLHFSVDGTGTRLQRGSVPGQARGHSSLTVLGNRQKAVLVLFIVGLDLNVGSAV